MYYLKSEREGERRKRWIILRAREDGGEERKCCVSLRERGRKETLDYFKREREGGEKS